MSGKTLPSLTQPYPSVGAATVVGLTDHDINIHDDQSVVITDYYSEQIKTGHLTLLGSGANGGGDGGRVTIAAVKSVRPSTYSEGTLCGWARFDMALSCSIDAYLFILSPVLVLLFCVS